MSDNPKIDVSIIVVSYNTRALTEAALSSVAAETNSASYEIIAVDNASTDGSAAMLQEHPAAPEVIPLDNNIGFARANNLAADRARGDYILLLNPDTVVLDSAIDRLVAFARQKPEARIWGGRTLFADGSLNPASCWHRMTLWNLLCRASGLTAIFPNREIFNGETYGGWRRDCERSVDIVSGCFLLIEHRLWQELGGFDPLFFMYGEDSDLCLRAAKIGARPVITPNATIKHFGGASEPVRTEKMVRLLSAKTSLIKRHWHPALAPFGVALLAAWPLSRSLSLAAAANITSKPVLADSAQTWWEIFSRRTEWIGGYAPTKHTEPARTLATHPARQMS